MSEAEPGGRGSAIDDRTAIWGARALAVLSLLWRLPRCFDAWPNPDEGAYYAIAISESWAALAAEITHHTHPPGIYAFHRLIGFASDDLALLRVPSTLGTALAVYGVFLIGRRVASNRAGLIAASAMALAPGIADLAVVLRPYGVLFGLLSFATASALGYAKESRPRQLVGAALLGALAMLVHYASLLILPGIGMALAAAAWNARERRRALGAVALVAGLWAAVAALLYATHLGPHLIAEERQARVADAWLSAFFHSDAIGLWSGFAGTLRYLLGPQDVLAAALVGAGAGVLIARRAWIGLLVLATPIGLAALASLTGQYPFGATRHSSYLSVALLPLLAVAVDAWLSLAVHKSALLLLVALPALLLPDAARHFAGVEENTVGSLGERVASTEDFTGALERLGALRETEALVLMDLQTYRFLTPALRAEGVRFERRSEHAAYHTHFEWGRAHVVVAEIWMLRTDPNEPGRPGHVYGVLRRMGWGVGREAKGEGWLLLGGWRVAGRTRWLRGAGAAAGQEAATLTSAAPPAGVLEIHEYPGLTAARIDWERYQQGIRDAHSADRRAAGGAVEPLPAR